jgi:hypothetical protein
MRWAGGNLPAWLNERGEAVLTGPELLAGRVRSNRIRSFFLTSAKQRRGSGEAESVRTANYYEAVRVGTCIPYCALPVAACRACTR